MSKISFSKLKKGLDKASDKFKKILPNDSEDLKKLLEKLIDSVNKEPSSTEIEGHTGKVGDLKVVKKSKDKYDFYIKGEDGWHKDMNSSFEAIDKGPSEPPELISIQQSDDGTVSHKFTGVTKFTIDLDAGTVTGVATPTLKANGNLKLQPTGTTTVDSTLAVNTIAAADSDTDKFLVSDSGTVKYRTGAEVLSDIGAGATAGSGSIVTTGALDSGSITSGFGAIDNGSSTIDTTGAVSTGALTCTTINTGQGANEVYDMDQNVKTDSSVTFADVSGASIWQSFPFIISSATHSRYYFIDNDDTANSYRRWDTYDTDPTGVDYRAVTGNFVVPEDCTLVAMHGVIANSTSTNNPTIKIYHGSVTESTSNTTLASAGYVTPSIGTSRVPYKFSKEDFDTDLSAGDIVVPTIYHADTGGTRTFVGSLTLKFITR